jgi:hypothetical protein
MEQVLRSGEVNQRTLDNLKISTDENYSEMSVGHGKSARMA